jgi:hypothetical protein
MSSAQQQTLIQANLQKSFRPPGDTDRQDNASTGIILTTTKSGFNKGK